MKDMDDHRQSGPAARDLEGELAAIWRRWEARQVDDLVGEIELVASAMPDEAAAEFERASARDSVGRTAEAAILYQRALDKGLDPWRRRRTAIQLASSSRLLGLPETGLRLVLKERGQRPEELDDALEAMLALILVDLGRAEEAAGIALQALSKHLPRYSRSVRSYAAELVASSGSGFEEPR